MKNIVSISLGSSRNDFEIKTTYLDQEFFIKRMGTDNDAERFIKLLHEWDTKADAIGLGGLFFPSIEPRSESFFKKMTNRFPFAHDATQKIMDESYKLKTPIYTGYALTNVAHEWTIRHIQFEMKDYFTNSRVLFLSGLFHHHMARVLTEYTENITCADPILDHGIPKFLNSLNDLELYASGVHKLLQFVPGNRLMNFATPIYSWNNELIKKALKNSFILVIPSVSFFEYAKRFEKGDLNGKVVISSNLYDDRLEYLKERGADVIIDTTPLVLDRPIGVNTLEAMMATALGKTKKLTDEDLLEVISLRGRIPKPRIIYAEGKPKRVNRFAFVIHPLSQENFKLEKSIQPFVKIPGMVDAIEKVVAYAPPWIYCKVSGIVSPADVETEGWLITLGGTPKQMMTHTPEFTYKRLLQAAKLAKSLGAQIMGLGAFTKVVGDAGVTVAKKAELPITTGNSYSASGALWAAADAARRMGLLEIGENKKIKGKAMVFGATGAIGSVCCRLMAMAFDEVYMCGRNPIKLISLKESIERETPGATVHITVNSDKHLEDMDVIVTATSGMGKKILDITKVKPGCVITDVARPLDLPASEVAKRPDVLVIESGEIQLPGDVKMKNIGLPQNVVYACLAETIVLTLEGKFEIFTIGRDIEWEKVKEIYKLGIKHGMNLASISGVNGVFTDEDIQRVKTLALEAREKKAKAAQAQPASL